VYQGSSRPYFSLRLSTICWGSDTSRVKGPPGIAFISRNENRTTVRSTGIVQRTRRMMYLATVSLVYLACKKAGRQMDRRIMSQHSARAEPFEEQQSWS